MKMNTNKWITKAMNEFIAAGFSKTEAIELVKAQVMLELAESIAFVGVEISKEKA